MPSSLLRSARALALLGTVCAFSGPEPLTWARSPRNITARDVGGGVSAQCAWGLLYFDCTVTSIPVIQNLGFHAEIKEQIKEIDVSATFDSHKIDLLHITNINPEVCASVALIGDLCIKVNALTWDAQKVTGCLQVGVGAVGAVAYFDVYCFTIPLAPPPDYPENVRSSLTAFEGTTHRDHTDGDASGYCLDLPGGDTTNGNLLWMWWCNGLPNQQWNFDSSKNILYYRSDPSKCVDLMGGDTDDGTRLQIWDCNGLANQQWGYDDNMKTLYYLASRRRLEDVGRRNSSLTPSVTERDASKCSDIAGGNIFNGAVVQIWDCNGLPNQAFSYWA